MTTNGEMLLESNLLESELERPNTKRDLLNQGEPYYLNDCSVPSLDKDEILEEITPELPVLPKNLHFELKQEKLEPVEPENENLKLESNGNAKEEAEVIKEEIDADESSDDEEEESSADSDEGNEV